MKKTVILLFACMGVLGAHAQFSTQTAGLASYEGNLLSAKYPVEWAVSGIDIAGLSVFFFSPDSDLVDPFKFLDFSESIGTGAPFALAAFVSADMAAGLGYEWRDRFDPLKGLAETLGEEVQSGQVDGVAIAGATGALTTGLWGEEGKTAVYAVTARTERGDFILFLGACSSEDALEYRDTYRLMHESVFMKTSMEGIPGKMQGFDRLSSGSLDIDYPNDWHPLWVESGDMKAGMFSPAPFSPDTLNDLEFPPAGNGASMAMIIIVTGDMADAVLEADWNSDEMFESMIESLGTKPQTTGKGAVTLNGVDGRWMSVNLTDKNGGKMSAYICFALDSAGALYSFVGTSPAQKFTADKKKYEGMIKSFEFAP